MKQLRNRTANRLTFADVTGNYEETKTIESKSESGTITTNATDGETKYVKPIYHTGYVFEVDKKLVVASSMANAIALYCTEKRCRETDVTNVKRLGIDITTYGCEGTDYDAIIEG